MKTKRHSMRIRLGIAALLILGATCAAAAPTEAASSDSWTHNQYYGYSLMKDSPHVNRGLVVANLYNDTKVRMLCWVDTENVTSRSYSNYNSKRWFKVRVVATGRVGYVHSSYVYYQISVGRC